MEVKLDKTLYREAYKTQRQWHQLAERHDLAYTSSFTPWQQFVDLWEFGWQMNITPTLEQQEEKLIMFNQYIAKIQKLESWRETHGRTS